MANVYGPMTRFGGGIMSDEVEAARRGGPVLRQYLSGLDAATKLIADLFPYDTLVPRPEMPFRKDWREQVNLVIREFLLTRRKTIQRLDKTGREERIAEIGSRGLLEMRHSSQYVAAQLGISRATLHNALGRARKEPQRAKA